MTKKASQPKKKTPPIDFSKPIESPLPDYPGTVKFAHPFLPRHYRAWREAYTARAEKGAAGGDAIVTFGSDPTAYMPYMWGDALAVCEISLENLPPDALTDSTGENTPVNVGAWIISIYQNHYFPQHLTPGG